MTAFALRDDRWMTAGCSIMRLTCQENDSRRNHKSEADRPLDKLNLTHLSPRGPRRSRRRPGGRRPESRRVDYERRVRKGAALPDLDLDLARSFLGDALPDGKSLLDSLRDYGLILGDDPEWKITNAALLLFARAPARHWNPGAGVRIIRVAGTARILGHRDSVVRSAYAGPPLAAAIDQSIRLAREQIEFSEPLRHIFLRHMPEYPEAAWRELIINAIAHRDYEASAETEVVFYDDRMEVTSPGLPVEPLSLADVRDDNVVHATRNPLLTRVLADSGRMHAIASGLERIVKEMEGYFLNEPALKAGDGRFTVVLRNEPQLPTAGPGWKRLVQKLKINPNQKHILLARPDGFTEREYGLLNSVTRSEASAQVCELVDSGVVTPEPADDGSGPTYYLTADLDDQRWFLEDRIPALREHFRGGSQLRNSDYRTLFETPYATAKRELDYLSEKGFLKANGKGRALHYRPAIGLRK